LLSRRYNLLVLSILSAGALSACDTGGKGDARTAFITPGISRDSVLRVLRAPLAGLPVPSDHSDSLGNVWREARYLAAGQLIHVIWYSPGNEKRTASDTVPEGDVTPIVLTDDKVLGVGRRTYDSVARVLSLPRNRY
jgi:hypothetical protein